MSDEKITFGQFVTKKTVGPAIKVDCSKMMDTSDGTWTFGQFVTKKTVGPAIKVDCSNLQWEPVTPHLRITVSFLPGVSLNTLQEVTEDLLLTLHNAAPDLGLVYDSARSVRVNGQAVIALTPQTPPADVEQRLDALRELARTAAIKSGNVTAVETAPG